MDQVPSDWGSPVTSWMGSSAGSQEELISACLMSMGPSHPENARNGLGWECLAEEKEAEENKENVDGSKDKEAEAGKKKVEHEISEGNVATAAAAALASAATKAKVGAVPTPWAWLPGTAELCLKCSLVPELWSSHSDP